MLRPELPGQRSKPVPGRRGLRALCPVAGHPELGLCDEVSRRNPEAVGDGPCGAGGGSGGHQLPEERAVSSEAERALGRW